MAEYEVLTYLRTRRRDRLVPDESLLRTLARESAEYLADSDRRLTALRRCMDELPERQRQMIARRYESDTPVAELAESFGRTVNSFSVTLHKIRKQLLKCIRRKLAEERA